ncbi:glycoside hydrolase family 3 protein [Oceanobacillus sp. M65]|uniref:glycoside hydrolase family 3 protein n=1 Tax=Oceanobacillus sp. M65 TaxID=3457435 RepID=UPI003FCCA60B
MKLKLRKVIAFLSAALLLLTLPIPGGMKNVSAAEKQDVNEDEINAIIDDMTLEEKIGQLFIVHVYGQTPTDPRYENTNLNNNRGGKNFQEVIENYHIGGLIYFNWSYNIGTPLDPEQVQSLSNGVQEIAVEQDSGIPLFISTDQEGGIVQRVTEPGTVFPGNMAIGATRSEEFAALSGNIIGKELNSLGINMNFAPTVDVNLNPANPVIGIRSFGEDPELVSKLGVSQINAYKEQNVIASAKHFPGHGDTDVDSHYGLPVIDHDLETLHEVDLKPFKEAIDAGVGSIMTGHIVVPALDDSGLPATLSKPIITDLLREELGYDGLIITDSLGMSGANVVPPDRVPVESFKAGVDILLNPPDVEVAYNGMLEAVQSGEISEERVEESVYRILRAKMENGLFEETQTSPDKLENIGTEANLQAAKDIADKSITLVKNEDVLPVQNDEKVLVTGPSVAKPSLLYQLLEEKGVDGRSYATGTSPTDSQIEQAVEHAADADKIIVTTYTANTNERQREFVEALQQTGKPVIVSAHRNPYDVMVFPEVGGYVASYSYLDVSINAVAGVLVGDINPYGKLPVTIPDLYNLGHSLDYTDTSLSAEGMKQLVDELAQQDEITDSQTTRALTTHLSAIERFEERELGDKVVKHLESFQDLIAHFHDNDKITDKAYSYLETESLKLHEVWTTQE